MHTSKATFSLGDQWHSTPSYKVNASSISVLGVPG